MWKQTNQRILTTSTYEYAAPHDDGFLLGVSGPWSSKEDQFWSPQGLATDDMFIYVADQNNHRIQKFHKSDGSFVAAFGGGGGGGGTGGSSSFEFEFEFDSPTGIALYGNSLFVADQYNHRVLRYPRRTVLWNESS
jgi:hypothetical protein